MDNRTANLLSHIHQVWAWETHQAQEDSWHRIETRNAFYNILAAAKTFGLIEEFSTDELTLREESDERA